LEEKRKIQKTQDRKKKRMGGMKEKLKKLKKIIKNKKQTY